MLRMEDGIQENSNWQCECWCNYLWSGLDLGEQLSIRPREGLVIYMSDETQWH